MAKQNDPAVSGFQPIEVTPYVDEAFQAIEVTFYEAPAVKAAQPPVRKPKPRPRSASTIPTPSPDAGENKEN